MTLLSEQQRSAFEEGRVYLTLRQYEVLTRAAAGMTTQETADDLHLSYWTVMSYRSQILNALRARNIPNAVATAMRLGLIP